MLDFLSSYSVMASLRRTRAEVWRSSQALAFVCFFLALRTGQAQDTPQLEALLLLVPAPGLGADNYTVLLGALQGQAGQAVKLRTAVASIDWAAVEKLSSAAADGYQNNETVALADTAMREAVKGAVDAGFQPVGSTTLTGRVENVFVLMAGASSAWATGYPMTNAGATVLLGGSLVPQDGVWADVYEYPRPLLQIFGQLDGEFTLAQAALAAEQAVAAAVQLGARYMAQARPLAVVEGLNAALLSNAQRGPLDLPSTAPQGPVLVQVARGITQFVEANHPSTSTSTEALAVAQLMQLTTAAVGVLSPYTEALGRGALQSLYTSNPDERGLSVGVMAPSLFGHGAEVLPPAFANRAFAAHPGELAAAEAFCISAQRRILSVLPDEAQASLQVIATVHTSLDMFTYSQPTVSTVQATSGNRTVVRAVCYLYREDLASAQDQGLPSAPQYFLKLRAAQVVAYALGLDLPAISETLTGEVLNREAYEKALQSVPPLVNQTFAQQGVPLSFAPDRNMTAEGRPAADWILAPQSLVYDAKTGSTMLTSPTFSTLPQNTPPFDRGPGRVAGSTYLKAMSPAWMQEWLMTQGLRQFCRYVSKQCANVQQR